jgi:hypothetical protein
MIFLIMLALTETLGENFAAIPILLPKRFEPAIEDHRGRATVHLIEVCKNSSNL